MPATRHIPIPMLKNRARTLIDVPNVTPAPLSANVPSYYKFRYLAHMC